MAMATKDEKIATITVNVPVRLPGNAIDHRKVLFEVFGNNPFSAVAKQDAATARITALPKELKFSVKDDWVTCRSSRFKYVAVDLFNELKKRGKI